MKLSRRELILGFATGAVLLLGLSYLLGEPAIARWQAARQVSGKLADEKKIAQRLIAQRGEWEARFQQQRAGIPAYGSNDQVRAVILKQIEQLASENGLTLPRVLPDKERNIGDLYELAVSCEWKGDLEPLVRFLYAVQKQGAILDIRQLSIAPDRSGGGRMQGEFTMFFAFSRAGSVVDVGAPAAAVPGPAGPAPAGNP